jgi:ribosome-binding factor A
VFGREGPDPKVQRGLESAAGFLRNALSRSLMIRHTPTLSFELDTSIEHGVRLSQLIDAVNKPANSDAARAPNAAAPAADSPDADSPDADSPDAGHVIDEG